MRSTVIRESKIQATETHPLSRARPLSAFRPSMDTDFSSIPATSLENFYTSACVQSLSARGSKSHSPRSLLGAPALRPPESGLQSRYVLPASRKHLLATAEIAR